MHAYGIHFVKRKCCAAEDHPILMIVTLYA